MRVYILHFFWQHRSGVADRFWILELISFLHVWGHHRTIMSDEAELLQLFGHKTKCHFQNFQTTPTHTNIQENSHRWTNFNATKGYFQLLGSEMFSHHGFESNIHKGSQELIPDLPSHTNIQENSHTWTNLNATKGSFQLLGSEVFSHHRFESNIHKGSQELIPDLPSHTNMHENPHRWTTLTQPKALFNYWGPDVFSHHCFEANIYKGSQQLIPDLPSHTNIQENSHRWTNFNATKGSFQLLGSEVFSHHRFESNIHKGSQELIPDLPSHTNMHENPHRWTTLTQPKALFNYWGPDVFSHHCFEANIYKGSQQLIPDLPSHTNIQENSHRWTNFNATKGYFQLLGSEVFSHHRFESNIHKGSQELILDLPSHTNIQENSHTWTNFNAIKGSFQLLGSEVFSHHRFESNIHKGSQELIPDLPSHTNMHENPHRWTTLTQPKALFNYWGPDVFSHHCFEANIYKGSQQLIPDLPSHTNIQENSHRWTNFNTTKGSFNYWGLKCFPTMVSNEAHEIKRTQ